MTGRQGAAERGPHSTLPRHGVREGVPTARSVTVRVRRPSRSHTSVGAPRHRAGLRIAPGCWRSTRRTRQRKGTTVTEDAARAPPARPPAPRCLLRPCRTAPCRPTATDLLTRALPHHQAPGALTPGWPGVAAITCVVSTRRGTPLPGRHVLSRRAGTPSDVCAYCLLSTPFPHPWVGIELRRARHASTFPQAPLRSRTVGFPEYGSDPGFPLKAFRNTRKLKRWLAYTPLLSRLPAGSSAKTGSSDTRR